MKVAKDTFLIHVHGPRKSEIDIPGVDNRKIRIDTDYNKYKHTTQTGTIYAVPINADSYELQVGDDVVFHHFVCQPDHRVNLVENLFRAEHFHIYAKLEKETVYPLEDAIFVEPILEAEDNLYAGKIRVKSFRENVKQQGIVFAASKKAQAAGIRSGDKVFFTASADYSMKVVGKDLYRMRIRNICMVERDGELFCINDKVLVKEIGPENPQGKFYDAVKSTQLTGMVMAVGKNITGVSPGQQISYFNSVLGSLEYKGAVYAFLELRNINYII